MTTFCQREGKSIVIPDRMFSRSMIEEGSKLNVGKFRNGSIYHRKEWPSGVRQAHFMMNNKYSAARLVNFFPVPAFNIHIKRTSI